MSIAKQGNYLKIALLCGGPSLERGVSLNSARSVCDHLQSENFQILPIYFDCHKNPYLISRSQLYSNTPSDFDFKLQETSKPLSKTAFHKLLKDVDLAFPVMHGAFGEDGQIQKILEKEGVPFVGSDSQSCKNCFDKFLANEFIKKHGFYTQPSMVLKIHEPNRHKNQLQKFFKKHQITRGIVKPATGGSSIGLHSVSTVEEALIASQNIFSKRIDTRVVIEPFCKGTEFTVIVLQNRFDQPVAVLPTEMEIDYKDHQVFDFRKKYLSTNQVTYHCPPRFSDATIEKIQIQAEQLFKLLGNQDFARFDGWLLEDGEIWFSDFNPISGMEQNSFLFMQTAQLGFSHRDLLLSIIKNACRRYKINFPKEEIQNREGKKKINVIFGGNTAERQVSVISGTNVWLKLRNSEKYDSQPFLLDLDSKTVWHLPYSKTLNHTVEEISQTCKEAPAAEQRILPLRRRVLEKLALNDGDISEELFIPYKMDLEEFIKRSEYVFIGLHGGIGENGEIQTMLEDAGIGFNGSGSKASNLCMDKYRTGEALKSLEGEGIYVPNQKLVKTNEIIKKDSKKLKSFWKNLKVSLSASSVIVKPPTDGCSAGIVKLTSSSDLKKYLEMIDLGVQQIPKNTFKNQLGPIEMPPERPENLLFEQFIYTDKVKVIQNNLKWERKTGWIEITIGVLGKGENLKALNPSLTVANGNVLSLEEKFQGGTGVNITPPPKEFVKNKAINSAKRRIELVAKTLGISGYARIDAFMEIKTGELIIIEANTAPGLTPSTVIFHQGLAEETPLSPLKFLETIIDQNYSEKRIHSKPKSKHNNIKKVPAG